jgi:hypothetical protein
MGSQRLHHLSLSEQIAIIAITTLFHFVGPEGAVRAGAGGGNKATESITVTVMRTHGEVGENG